MWVEWQTNRETNLTPKQYSAWGAKHDMKENTSMRTLSLALHLCFTSFHLISKTFITWPGLYHALLAHWGRAWVWVPTRSSFMHGSWDPEVWGNQKCLDKQTCSVVRDVLFGALDNRTLCSFCSWLGSMNHEKHLKWNSTKSEFGIFNVWQFGSSFVAPHLLTKNVEKTRQLGRVRRCRKRLARASAVNGMYWMYNECTTVQTPLKAPKLQASPVAAPGKRKAASDFPKFSSWVPAWRYWYGLAVASPGGTMCNLLQNLNLAISLWNDLVFSRRTGFEELGVKVKLWGPAVKVRTISTSIACSIPGIVNRWYGKGCAWQMARSWWCESFWLQQFPPKICFLIVFDWFWDLHPLPACMAWGCGTGYPAARGAVYLRSKGRSLKTQWDWALNLFFKGRPWVANSCLWGPCDAGKVWGW